MKARFRLLTAADQLQVLRRQPKVLAKLCAQGLALEDAAALAYNISFLWKALSSPALGNPEEALGLFSLWQIAFLCQEWQKTAEEMNAIEIENPAQEVEE